MIAPPLLDKVTQLRALLPGAPGRAGAVEGDPRAELAADLLGFLADLPAWIHEPIARLEEVPPEPPRAWDEPAASPYWLLAALIQDVWEHAFGPEAEADPPIHAFLARTVSGRALDFGCGAGTFAFPLARHGVEVTCVEANPLKRELLAWRRERRPEGSRISLAPPRGLYDAALAINVLDHLEDPAGAVRRLARRLRPGGALLFRAGFPEDGWHHGADAPGAAAAIRDTLFAELMRLFHYPEPWEDSGDETVLLRRRRRSRRRPPPKAIRRDRRGQVRARLDPATRLIPQPGEAGQLIFAAPRFYARPLLLTAHGAVLTRHCAAGLSVAEICRAMAARGVSEEEAAAALHEMARSNLIVFEPADQEA